MIDLLDSRDLQDRINELETSADLDSYDKEELKNLKELKDDVASDDEWGYGIIFVNEDDFEEYTQELLDDIGLIQRDLPGFIVIDWEATSNNVKIDYESIEYNDSTYLYRI